MRGLIMKNFKIKDLAAFTPEGFNKKELPLQRNMTSHLT